MSAPNAETPPRTETITREAWLARVAAQVQADLDALAMREVAAGVGMGLDNRPWVQADEADRLAVGER